MFWGLKEATYVASWAYDRNSISFSFYPHLTTRETWLTFLGCLVKISLQSTPTSGITRLMWVILNTSSPASVLYMLVCTRLFTTISIQVFLVPTSCWVLLWLIYLHNSNEMQSIPLSNMQIRKVGHRELTDLPNFIAGTGRDRVKPR